MTFLTRVVFASLLVLAFAATGCNGSAPEEKPPQTRPPVAEPVKPPQTPAEQPGETMKVVVFHATGDAMWLIPEIHVVPRSEQPALSALALLLSEPRDKNLVRALPAGTKLRGLQVKDHVAVVDFSEALIKNGPGGSAAEMLAVGAIVNTLTEYPDIRSVQILVEGRRVETLSGHVDVSHPVGRAESIIRKPQP